MQYHRLSFLLPRASEEPLAARLWELGTLGLELREGDGDRLRIDAWFAEPPPLAPFQRAARIQLIDCVRIDERDWMAAYRRQARPIRVGAGLIVDPGDERGAAPAGGSALRLHLPARRAFGTGGHASTRLAVELLERRPVVGRTVIDLGTGTGILAFVAVARGARLVVGLDSDPVAAASAGENRRRNRLWPALAAGEIDCLAARPRFDLALVNIRPQRITGALAGLVRRLRPGAEAIFSGLLKSEAGAFETRLGEVGLATLVRRRREEWMALAARLEA